MIGETHEDNSRKQCNTIHNTIVSRIFAAGLGHAVIRMATEVWR